MAQNTTPLKQLRQALEALHQALEAVENALIEFEETLGGGGAGEEEEGRQRPQQGDGTGFQLLSIPEVCQELGMSKSWVYRQIKNGEIPSVKLGHNIKVKREDLEQYLAGRRYRPSAGEK